MSKKILEVEGSALKEVYQRGVGRIYSAHKKKDIDKWLTSLYGTNGVMCDFEFERLFKNRKSWSFGWDEEYVEEHLSEFEVKFSDADHSEFRNNYNLYFENSIRCELNESLCEQEYFDKEIKQFLDRESIKNKEKNK